MEFDPRRSFVNGFGWEDPRTEEGELYWPERFPRAFVERQKFQLGPYAVAAQYQQEPAPRGGGIIKSDWWQMWPPGGEKDDTSIKPAQFPDLEYVLASVDTAMTEDAANDESAMTVWGIFREPSSVLEQGGLPSFMRDASTKFAVRDDGVALVGEMPAVMLPRAILLYSWSGRVQFHDLVMKIIEVCTKRKVDALLVEAKNTGIAVAQEIVRLCLDQTWATYAQPVKGDKTARLYSVQHLFSSGMIFAPDRTWAQRVISQCEVYPKGRHDDLVDTTSQALQYMRMIGLLALKDEAQIEAQRLLLAVPRGGSLERRAPYDV
jgi:predicted phage terminase large subunit-like protein